MELISLLVINNGLIINYGHIFNNSYQSSATTYFSISFNTILGGSLSRYGIFHGSPWASHTNYIKSWNNTSVTIEVSSEGNSDRADFAIGNVYWFIFGI